NGYYNLWLLFLNINVIYTLGSGVGQILVVNNCLDFGGSISIVINSGTVIIAAIYNPDIKVGGIFQICKNFDINPETCRFQVTYNKGSGTTTLLGTATVSDLDATYGLIAQDLGTVVVGDGVIGITTSLASGVKMTSLNVQTNSTFNSAANNVTVTGTNSI